MKECQHPFSKAPQKKNNLFDIQQRKRKKYQMVLILKEMKVTILKQWRKTKEKKIFFVTSGGYFSAWYIEWARSDCFLKVKPSFL